MIKIKRALLSVTDKTGITELVAALVQRGCTLISTGGTGRVLAEAQIPFVEISKITGNPEAFGGRMKTISFATLSAILFDREKDVREARELSIEPIDMVVCNLYDFEAAAKRSAPFEELIEKIDIGGPTMIRAAAKNFAFVAAVTSPSQYERIIQELNREQGALSLATRKSLMSQAFQLTAAYEKTIADVMNGSGDDASLAMVFSGKENLRYGENPHQRASFYFRQDLDYTLYNLQKRGGKELSYNNIVDIEAACFAVKDLPGPACAIIKHTNPCGLATSRDPNELLALAWEGDPLSAFGSVISFNTEVGREMLTFLSLDSPQKDRRKFVEVIVAPSFTPPAFAYLSLQKNLRIVELDPRRLPYTDDFKYLAGSLLHQSCDPIETSGCEWVTATKPMDNKNDLLFFGINAVRAVKSNAIVLVREVHPSRFQLIGMGAGQPNRVTSVKIAIERMNENLNREALVRQTPPEDFCNKAKSSVLAVSDAFFPFPDSIDLLHLAGIKSVVSPGGSINDKAVIQKCNELEMIMGFTGVRHFRH